MSRATEQPSSTAIESGGDRMLGAIADHLHDHCTCAHLSDGLCDACEVRVELRSIREELLAWRAQGRRLTQRRDEALANAHAQVQRRRASCNECAGLSGLASMTKVDG